MTAPTVGGLMELVLDYGGYRFDSLIGAADREFAAIRAYAEGLAATPPQPAREVRMTADQRDAERYRWLCKKFGITKLPCALERIIAGDVYVADGKESIDAAIDAAMATPQGEQQ